jgi:hypothetical protein
MLRPPSLVCDWLGSCSHSRELERKKVAWSRVCLGVDIMPAEKGIPIDHLLTSAPCPGMVGAAVLDQFPCVRGENIGTWGRRDCPILGMFG